MVTVLSVSDEVVESLWTKQVERLRVDLLVGLGDLPFAYLAYLSDALNAPCVFVPGNHDCDLSGYSRGSAGWLRAGLPSQWPGPAGAVNADGRVVDVAGLRVAGLGGSPRYNCGPNQWTQSQQRRRALQLAIRGRWRCRDGRGVDLLLTHAPPRGVGDAEDGPHQGFDCLHELAQRMAPTVLLHGHVHPHGMAPTDRWMGTVQVINTVGFSVLQLEPGAGVLEVTERRHGV